MAWENALIRACIHGNLESVRCFVSVGANIRHNDDHALRCASENGHLNVVMYLVSMGANVHASNNQSLVYACSNGHLKIVKYLVSKGASDLDVAMQWADDAGQRNVVMYLLSVGVIPPRLGG